MVAPSVGGTPLIATAQATPTELTRILQEDPDAIRRRIAESGMTMTEIRSRLIAAGLPAGQLDAFINAPAGTTLSLDQNTLAALQQLGLDEVVPDGVAQIEPQTGLQGLEQSPARSGPRIFGMDVFRRATTQFQPLFYGPVPDEYRLGPGDSLVLVLTGDVESAQELPVGRDGYVVVQDVGRVPVANLTVADLRSLLRDRLGAVYSGIGRGTTDFDVTVTRQRTIQVYVSGEVLQPGAFQLASVATVLNALYAAGGPTDLGSLREVRVRRRSGEVSDIDLYPYLLTGDPIGDLSLQQGDAIFVPIRSRRVFVGGAVGRPAYYDLSESEDLLSALTAAGGFAPTASLRRLTIQRVVRPPDRGPGLGDWAAIDLELTAAIDSTHTRELGGVVIPPIALTDGDSIVVDRVGNLRDGYYVQVSGHVVSPGLMPWREGLTLREALLVARGPDVGADLREAEVSRLPDNRSGGELADILFVPIDSSYLSQRDALGRYVGPPGLQFDPPGTAPEFVLQPYDRVHIRQQPDFEMPTTVEIRGEVPLPGRYTLLSKSERVSDLILRANGILPTGYSEGARLYRNLEGLGRIDLDLPDALASPGSANDLILQSGDSLYIPAYSPTVVVTGAVASPVTVLYREGAGLDYYIENAGGFSHDADKGRLSVRYANGSARTRSKFLFWSSYPTPEPGSEVFVPPKDPAAGVATTTLIRDIVSIAGSVATVAIVLARVR